MAAAETEPETGPPRCDARQAEVYRHAGCGPMVARFAHREDDEAVISSDLQLLAQGSPRFLVVVSVLYCCVRLVAVTVTHVPLY